MIACPKAILSVGILLIGSLAARTVDELKVAYEVKILTLGRNYRTDLEKLADGYVRALDQVQEKLQKAGRLEDVLKIVEEKKDLKADRWPLAILDDSAPTDLLRFRKIYETSRIRVDREHASAVIETADKMRELLEGQMKSLTREGNIAEAKKAKELLEAIGSDEEIKAARELVQRVRLNQNAPVAYRLRRSGDNLEVLVRFDKSGKVSLDSPVENVVEITGGRADKGKTKATVLGEFVGAKGYEVDSFVSYENSNDEVEPPLNAVSFQLESRFEYEGRKCLKITMPEKAPNPRVEWFQVLASEASASLIKIDFWYHIPKENGKVEAFSFHYGMATPIERKVFDTKGRWVQESLTTSSLNKWDTLRFYVRNMSGSGKTFDGGNESVYLDDLRVTFLSFAAHIVERYEGGKPVGKPIEEPSAQPAFILEGKLSNSPNN